MEIHYLERLDLFKKIVNEVCEIQIMMTEMRCLLLILGENDDYVSYESCFDIMLAQLSKCPEILSELLVSLTLYS